MGLAEEEMNIKFLIDLFVSDGSLTSVGLASLILMVCAIYVMFVYLVAKFEKGLDLTDVMLLAVVCLLAFFVFCGVVYALVKLLSFPVFIVLVIGIAGVLSISARVYNLGRRHGNV